MKDVAPARHSRNSLVYPKKRPSPHGITKSHKSPLLPANGLARRTPRTTKMALIQQKQREAHIQALRREHAMLEEEYRDEIRYCMLDKERCTMSSTQSMDQQPEIRWHMRPCLVDFLVEIHFTFRLRPETLYLTLNIVDRYVSRRVVYTKHYQLVGCAALWIAAKYEDAKDRVPTLQDLVQICRETYEESAFVQMEGHVLSTIDWVLGHPTAEAWLRLICCGPHVEETKVQHVARFLMEVTLFYREFVKYPPSTISLASLTLARFLCGKSRRPWEETEECLEVIELLDTRLALHVDDLSETLVKKYSYAFYSKAATFVVQYYLEGNRFNFQNSSIFPAPVTPKRSSVYAISTPTSSNTSASDVSDDMPLTPVTPAFSNVSSDPFIGPHSSDDKENVSSNFESVITKVRTEHIPEHLLPHELVALGRGVLHNLNNNVASPRTALVS
ncbi:hypothetical protein D9613_001950 [Agrocybe pediades]|uniref:Cyclin N-terminal domain-containing protein n=1 Tax=Agrocybe pediades TaxID=84607 RepID=A0A8H4VUG7_9AGAR|nr:hypothetical protein D9613_001950 [Agrocybe pediades]KAF9569731.1 cyclin [Agrocybe pediades]